MRYGLILMNYVIAAFLSTLFRMLICDAVVFR